MKNLRPTTESICTLTRLPKGIHGHIAVEERLESHILFLLLEMLSHPPLSFSLTPTYVSSPPGSIP